MAKKRPPIKYTDRDFESIKNSLVEHARRYYPDTFKDFSEASFGSLMIDTVAYVGDVLSFYLDYQANESFLTTAIEFDNVVKLAKQMGYKYQESHSSVGTVTFYILVPARATGLGPDPDYIPILKRGTEISTNGTATFYLTEDVDFSKEQNEVVVGTVNATTGEATHYAIKAHGQVISGIIAQELIEIGSFEKLRRIELDSSDVVEVLTITDAEGHEYFEVDYLSQDVIFKEIPNKSSDTDEPVALLKPYAVPRRFVAEFEENRCFLQFGYGSEESLETDKVVKASEVILDITGKNYTATDSFDPSNINSTDKLGVGPANTTLIVTYRKNTSTNVNAFTDQLVNISNPLFDFTKENLLTSKTADVIGSLECTNEEPILGQVSSMTADEIKRHAIDAYASQNRAVTSHDYKSVVYRMPTKFGKVKRCEILQDLDSLKRNLNLYVLGEDAAGKLSETNRTVKENLKQWLASYKMLNDTVDILDAQIFNFGIEFSILSTEETNKFEILEKAKSALAKYFEKPLEIGESIQITDLYNVLKNVEGVADATKLKIVNRAISGYSSYSINIDKQMSSDGRHLFIPETVVAELKYPNADIMGTVK
tara:strand:+ start:1171 stop:2961 length:1791 start_codon:yes stop_codon:yes gene_type:complete